jgi:Glycosyl hydrolase family 79, N-terminal domain
MIVGRNSVNVKGKIRLKRLRQTYRAGDSQDAENWMRKIYGVCREVRACLILIALIAATCPGAFTEELSITPASMVRIGTVDERFQSYNVEMIDVTGGNFWRPYDSNTSHGHPDLYQYRPPIDLTNPRLRKLAAALSPAYMRVSGTWANATYFADSDSAPSAPPPGFNGVLSRQQWRGVLNFSQAVGAQIVTSFAVSLGTRDLAGIWSPGQARRFLTYTYSVGGRVAAAEFMNEPNVAGKGIAPAGYDAAAYGRDFKIFRLFVKENFPEIIILGPGTVGETPLASDLLAASGPGGVDAFSYHHYGTLSERCSDTSAPEAALSEEWLSRTDHTITFYRSLRDKFAPGKPIWLTETAEASCGGNRWDATFLDTFRYLDQLGRLARAGVQVVMHNTLAASDYGLLDERTLTPRPNYWGALLWRQLMGNIVLDSGLPIQPGFHVYAHCQRGTAGGVSLLIINTDRNAPHSLRLPTTSERYTLDAASLRDTTVRLNDRTLELGVRDDLPRIASVRTVAGTLTFAPSTITFLAIPAAANSACR